MKAILKEIAIFAGFFLVLFILLGFMINVIDQELAERERRENILKEKCIENGHTWIESTCIPKK